MAERVCQWPQRQKRWTRMIKNRLVLTYTQTYYIQPDKHLPLGPKRGFLFRFGEKMFPSAILLPIPGSPAVRQPQLELRVPGQRVAVGAGGRKLLHGFGKCNVCGSVIQKGSLFANGCRPDIIIIMIFFKEKRPNALVHPSAVQQIHVRKFDSSRSDSVQPLAG